MLACILTLFLTIPADSLTTNEYWLAKVIYHEARNESVKGKAAVALVTINRSKSKLFPNSIEKVVKQRNQFSWYTKQVKVNDQQAWRQSIQIAKQTLQGETFGLQLKNVYYFHNKRIKPSWSHKLQRAIVIDNHVFYRITS